MLFSVLIPLFNSREYLPECLESILAQTFDDYEIVIADDGSTDGGSAVADSFMERFPDKIRVIHKQNEGVLLTRRRLLYEAKGDFIIWVDSDDVIKPSLMSYLSETIRAEDPDIIIADYEMLDDADKVIHSMHGRDDCVFEGQEKKEVCRELILGRDMKSLWTKCMRRDIIDIDADYSPYRHVSMADDFFCLMPIIDKARKIKYTRQSFYRYRYVSTGITKTSNYKSYDSFRTVYERAVKYADKWDFDKPEKNALKDVIAYRFVDCVFDCVKCKTASYSDYLNLSRQIIADEGRKKVFSDGKRIMNSKPYQLAYSMLIRKRFVTLYLYIKTVNRLSRLLAAAGRS